MNREELDRIIADLEEQERQAKAMLPHFRAARLALESAPSKASDPKREREKAVENGDSAQIAHLFPAKYDKPGKVLVVDSLALLRNQDAHAGLSRRGIREALEAKGKPFSSQFVAFAIKELEDEGVVERVPAPPDSAAKWHFRLNPRHPGATEKP
jgi:hypothetical protein